MAYGIVRVSDGRAGLRRRRVVPRRAREAVVAAVATRPRLLRCDRPRRRASRVDARSRVPILTSASRMRHTSASRRAPRRARGGDWATIRTLLPYLWEYKGRVLAALACLVAGQGRQRRRAAAAEGDRRQPGRAHGGAVRAARAAGRLRPAAAVDDGVHRAARVPVRQGDAARGAQDRARRCSATCTRCRCASICARQTGGLTRDVERGQRGISTLISFALFSILPTLVEIALVSAILIARYDWTFMAITAGALVALHRVHRARSPSGARTSGAR